MNITHTLLTAWILKMLTALEPSAPWAATYPDTADVLARVSLDTPLYAGGDDGVKRTASLLVSLAWFEGRLNPVAKGDCRKKDDKGRCIADPQSFCLFQIGKSNFEGLGVREDQLLESTELCTRTAVRLIKISFGVCRDLDRLERLGHYASGGSTCRGLVESRHRILKSDWLFAHTAFPTP